MISSYLLIAALITQPFEEPWGTDSDLRRPSAPTRPTEMSLGTRLAEAVIHFHQTIISPVDGPRSHFRPSSSQYMKVAMYRYGFLKGFVMGCDRLLRENEEEWIYRTVETADGLFKYDPACIDKGHLDLNEITFY